jgi:hypothetical protein
VAIGDKSILYFGRYPAVLVVFAGRTAKMKQKAQDTTTLQDIPGLQDMQDILNS